MDRADFSGTNLTNALLNGVIASGSSFAGASIEGADFSDALLDRDDVVRLCRDAEGESHHRHGHPRQPGLLRVFNRSSL